MNIPGRVPSSLFGAVLAMAQRRPVFTADYYSVDGSTGKVGAFIDWNDASHTLSQSGGSSLQVAVPAAHADFNGKLCATFTGSEYYVSSRASSNFRYCHDGSGFFQVAVYTRTTSLDTRTIFATCNIGAAVGYAHWLNSTPAARLWVYNGSTNVANNIATSSGLDVPTYSAVAFSSQLGTLATNVWIKGTLSSASILAVPTSVDSGGTLYFGASTATAFGLRARWRSGMFAPFLTVAEISAIQSWIQQDTGITP